MLADSEKTSLLVVGIGLFVAGCVLGKIFNTQILGEIARAVPLGNRMIATGVMAPFLVSLEITLACGLFLSVPMIAIALARPLIDSLLLRGAASYALSILVSSCVALAWLKVGVRGGASLADLPILPIVLSGPASVLMLAGIVAVRR